MTKVNLKLTAKKLFNDYMGIDISVAKITLMECSTENVNVSYNEQYERVTYIYFVVGNRHYVYTDKLFKSFAMFPDETLTNGIELKK
jgi:hypothetical protein